MAKTANLPRRGRRAQRAHAGHLDRPRARHRPAARDAGIARATFYEYFQDVYAVATWMWDYLMRTTLYQAGDRARAATTPTCAKFQALREHREFFVNAMRIVSYNSICQHRRPA